MRTHDHRSPRYARGRPRRVLAVVSGACLGLFWVDAAVSWFLAPSDTAMIVNFVILGVGVVAGALLGGMLIAATGGTIARRWHELDERELTGRFRAFTTAHRCTTAVIALVIAVIMIATTGEGEDMHVPGAALFLILFALLVTHVLLPLVVATWQMPDPPADEDDGFDDEPAEDRARTR